MEDFGSDEDANTTELGGRIREAYGLAKPPTPMLVPVLTQQQTIKILAACTAIAVLSGIGAGILEAFLEVPTLGFVVGFAATYTAGAVTALLLAKLRPLVSTHD